jgi:transcriptional regulator with XRE-family HTH domain
MVTGRYKKRPRPLFIKEWQEHWGISAETMAERMGIERESYYRLLRELHRINIDKLAQLADAMGNGMEPPDFYRPPTRQSVDSMLEGVPEDVRETAIDIVRRLVRKAS